MAIPEPLLRVARMLGDHTDRIDLPEMKVAETLDSPAEDYLLENITAVSPSSSIVKALSIMEVSNSSYLFLIEDGQYLGIVTRLRIARRMLSCLKETRQGRNQTSSTTKTDTDPE
jgi:CBS domain-containing protein